MTTEPTEQTRALSAEERAAAEGGHPGDAIDESVGAIAADEPIEEVHAVDEDEVEGLHSILFERWINDRVDVVVYNPTEDPVTVAQVGLQFIGHTTLHTGQGTMKGYGTFITPELAIQLGEAIAQAGRDALQIQEALGGGPQTKPTPSGLIVAGPEQARAEAARAEQAARLRNGSG